MSDGAEGLTRGQVRMAYRLILGREPENVAVLDQHIAKHADLASLRRAFIQSSEFARSYQRARSGMIPEVETGYFAPAGRIEHDVDPATADALSDRTRAQWTKLGEADPYWSVLTDERYRSARIDEAALAEFKASGERAANLIDLTAARAGLTPPAGTCLELGCGVGRITRFLADRFERVIAVDISPGNLALCERYMADEGIANVETRLVRSLDDFAALPAFDHFYSVIVLQHNPPPVQRRILETLLPKLRAHGQFVFQTVADQPGYSFDAQRHLASAEPELEMHALPMAAITRLLREAGVTLDTVRLDPWTGFYGSYTFAGHRGA